MIGEAMRPMLPAKYASDADEAASGSLDNLKILS